MLNICPSSPCLIFLKLCISVTPHRISWDLIIKDFPGIVFLNILLSQDRNTELGETFDLSTAIITASLSIRSGEDWLIKECKHCVVNSTSLLQGLFPSLGSWDLFEMAKSDVE